MNYYEEIYSSICKLIDEHEYDSAKRMILNELDLPYVPKDFEEKLNILLEKIQEKTFQPKTFTEEEILAFLNGDPQHQLLAVEQLDKLNLRDHISICERFLSDDGFINAKVLLIDSLIRQQVNHVFLFRNEEYETEFNPVEILPVQEAEGYLRALEALQESFLKEPSMLRLAEQLLYKEAMMALPSNLDQNEGIRIAEKIEKYIRKAFE